MKYIEFDNRLRSSYSFALEEYIMRNPEFDDEYFLFWRTRPTLMIGRFQNTIREINLRFVKDNKIDVVRRNSGGGAIYTDENCWQFSFITRREDGQDKDFRNFTKPVIEALAELGINAEFSGRNDLMAAGKKFSGNAQFGFKNRFLHHGTVLFDTNLDNLIKSLNVGDEKIVSKGIKSVRERVTNIKELLNNPNMSALDFKNEMIALLSREMETVYLTEEQKAKIEELETGKFLTWDWNYGNSPEFNITRSKRFAGGKVEIRLNVKRGIITECSIYGDFFGTGDIAAICDLLRGAKYERNELFEILNNAEDAHQFMQISVEDLLSCFVE